MSVTFPSEAERSVLLASATDKTGLLPFVRSLEQIQATNGRVLLTLSTGGTYDVLQDS